VLHISSLDMLLPLCLGVSPQVVHINQHQLNFLVAPHFALQIDQICNVTFLHYAFSVFFLKWCKGSFICVTHTEILIAVTSCFNSPFQQTEEITYDNFTQTWTSVSTWLPQTWMGVLYRKPRTTSFHRYLPLLRV
jgi:hypothetical protein